MSEPPTLHERRRSRPVRLCPDLFPGDRLARLVHGGVRLAGVLRVLSPPESLDHRLWHDGRDPLSAIGQVSDDATAGFVHSVHNSRAVDWQVTRGFAHGRDATWTEPANLLDVKRAKALDRPAV
jgi:hypothetical protein